jgi:ectoine hydroxylase-related dioxygenase (phytanoyl-CoA dioxygenase family)
MSDARQVITDAEAQFFRDNGYLILRGVLQGEELARMRQAMDELTAYGSSDIREGPDFMYGRGHKTGGQVLKRIEYVIDKTEAGKILLGHPCILRSVEKLMGRDLIPTWDSMVLKMPGEGIVVPWHRDAGTEFVGDQPIFNVDFYMDDADLDTCLWVIPGSQAWGAREAQARITELNRDGFSTAGAVPAPMRAGDVIFHNILVLHGSPPNASGKLRRVVYYEFRAAHVEDRIGPHVPAYIPLKQKVLLDCIERRKRADYIPPEEVPYAYQPPAPYDAVALAPGEVLPTYRYPHHEYWRR